MRTVVFGVDGLTFRVLHPLIERGDLPNFKKLSQDGCESTLQSKYPPLTPPAWTSLSTGLKPARHGVYDFWMYEHQEHNPARDPRVQTKRKGGKAIWNILSEYGKQVLVINVPVTYPPEPVNGIMISGYMTPSSNVDFTYPSNFKEELYRVVPDYQIDLDLRSFWRKPRAMELSAQLGARFAKLQDAYPVKRSALIPMLMYAQDEFGFVSDEMIAEIARRLELRTVQVEETLAYYSMLHRKPMGKHHVQVCTNVACMLRGGYDILNQAKKRLEIGHKEVTKDGIFSLEEVECIGACSWAPAVQVNYDFHHAVTPEKLDRLLDTLKKIQ